MADAITSMSKPVEQPKVEPKKVPEPVKAEPKKKDDHPNGVLAPNGKTRIKYN